MSKNTFKIYACAVDYQYVYTFCPNPKCRQQLHIYRSNGDISDRKFKITNHCYMVDSPEKIQVCITPATKRSGLTHYRNGSFIFSDRKFKSSHPKFAPKLPCPSEKNSPIKKRKNYKLKKSKLVVNFD